MSKITITEALAEIKTIDARIAKKREFIGQHLVRQEMLRDPLEKDGGTRVVIARERQSVTDLMERKLTLRRAIQQANEETTASVNGTTRTIADWLVWRRDVAPSQREMLAGFWNTIQSVRNDAVRKGLSVVTTADLATRPTDIVVNTDESALASEREKLEEVYGALDGQLSLKNATILIDV